MILSVPMQAGDGMAASWDRHHWTEKQEGPRTAAFLVKPVALANLTEALERALAGGKVAIPRLDKDPDVLPSDASAEVVLQISEPASAPVENESRPSPPPRRPLDVKA